MAVLSIPGSCVDIPVAAGSLFSSPGTEWRRVGHGASQPFWALEEVSDWPAAPLAPGPWLAVFPPRALNLFYPRLD